MVVFLGLGVVGLDVPRGAVAPAAEEDGGGGAPVRTGRGGGVGELRGVEAKLDVGSIWADRLWRRGSTAGLRLTGVRWSGGGVPGRGVEELAKARREKKEEVLLVLMRARGEGLGHCVGLATAALRWRPAVASLGAWREMEAPAQGKGGR